DADIAAHRIFNDIQEGKRSEEDAKSINQTLIALKRQAEDTRSRYWKEYGIDIGNLKSFDLIIASDEKTTEEITEIIRSRYRAWLQGS
ncbi:MAG: hypothetical protein HKN20_03555, partial [Gemmatimonadetes bacterium]|nr:hypothetical protein [Gemmatimonadota bacterium]